MPANNLGCRVAAVDFDGEAALDSWTGAEDMDAKKTNQLFPSIVQRCDRIEDFVSQVS